MNFVGNSFNALPHFMIGDLNKAQHNNVSALTGLIIFFNFFFTKYGMIFMLHSSYPLDLTSSDFSFLSLGENIPQRETFCQCEKVEATTTTKVAEALKNIKISEFKNCFEQR